METTLPQSVNGSTREGVPLLPALAEAPCSVNVRFRVHGYLDAGQATGRGFSPEEAAENLRRTIEATRAALAPPPAVPLPLANRTTRLALLLACGTEKALVRGDRALIERLAKAYLLVIDGKVEPASEEIPCLRYHVGSQQPDGPIYEVEGLTCTCYDSRHHAADETRYACKHSLGVLYCQRLTEQEDQGGA